MNEHRIMIGNRLVAQLRNHRQVPELGGGVLCEFTVWFDESMPTRDREVVILNYLKELFKEK